MFCIQTHALRTFDEHVARAKGGDTIRIYELLMPAPVKPGMALVYPNPEEALRDILMHVRCIENLLAREDSALTG